ncbi:3-dehydroquinate synthase [Slackia heliotrinireducens]|uniref:3-dehydroquinate synthase n=1 Tax=Slackia heliotrinireducens TaxID=84110 RepID=UPI0033155589
MIRTDGNGNSVVHVATGEQYDVTIGKGLIGQVASFVPSLEKVSRVAVVADDVVEGLFLGDVTDGLKRAGFEVSAFAFPAGEPSKNIHTFAAVLEHLAEHRMTRNDMVVALGGGVVGDVAGFAAASYMRGCPYVQVPTTMLAAVDSSVGGKTAIDLQAGKNLAGAFYQPSAVVCDIDCIAALPSGEFANGMAEALKYGVLCDAGLFDDLGDNPRDHLQELIARCVDIKRRYVEADEHEGGLRKFLNLGHTFGHAIEKCSGYAVPHGSAVAIGMVMAARVSASRGMADQALVDRLARALESAGLPTSTDIPAEELAWAAQSDKKRSGDTVTFVLPKTIGNCELVDVGVAELGGVFETACQK